MASPLAYAGALALTFGLLMGPTACGSDDGPPQRQVLMLAECVAPVPPTIPNGATASEEDIRRGREIVSSYVSAGEAYMQCLADQEAMLDEDSPPERRKSLVARHNRMLDEMKRVADEFNAELQRYHERGSESS